MQVDFWASEHDVAIFNSSARDYLCKNIMLCCATLTVLYLDGLAVEKCFSKLSTQSGFACSDLKVTAQLQIRAMSGPKCGHHRHRALLEPQDTLCQCTQLRFLHMAVKAEEKRLPDASSLLMELAAAMPHLTVLQWRDRGQPRCKNTRHIFDAFLDRPWMDRKAEKSLAGPGLRLLQAEECSFGNVPALPASLQICSLQNWYWQPDRLFQGLHRLLAPCASLRELYILPLSTLGDTAALDLPSIAATCPMLQVLVLHVSPFNKQRLWVSPSPHSTMYSPCNLSMPYSR